MSLNDVCCYIPAWFGVLATFFTGMLAYECSLPVISDHEHEQPFGSILDTIAPLSWLHRKITGMGLTIMETVLGTDLGLRHTSVLPKCNGWIDVSSPAVEIALFTGMIMSIVPAHLMRSMGGGYDNEAVAVFAMVLTFYLWTRSLRGGMYVDSGFTWVWGAVTGVAYFNVSATSLNYDVMVHVMHMHMLCASTSPFAD